MADYPEFVISAEARSRLHQGMDDEQVDAVWAEVRAELAAEPPIEPMSDLQVAVRKAKGDWLTTDGRRERQAYRLAVEGSDA